MQTKLFSKQSGKLIRGGRWKTFTKQEKVILPIVHVFLAIMAAWVILPIVFVLINSFKTVHEFNDNPLALPKVFNFKNYLTAFTLNYRNTTVLQMFMNSIIFGITFSLANIASSTMAAYVIAKYNFRGKNFIYTLAIIVQIIPIFGTGSASYLLLSDLGLIDNIWLLWITAAAGFDYTFLLLHSYFRNLSSEYSEAAQIDGAGNWFIFLKIMLPMVLPAILPLWLTAIVGLWSDYMTPMLYLQYTPTLATGIYNLKERSAFIEGGTPAYMATLIVSIMPMIILFIFTQKSIFSINLEGGLKG